MHTHSHTHPYAVQGSGLISQETDNAGVGVPPWQRRSLQSRMQSEVNPNWNQLERGARLKSKGLQKKKKKMKRSAQISKVWLWNVILHPWQILSMNYERLEIVTVKSCQLFISTCWVIFSFMITFQFVVHQEQPWEEGASNSQWVCYDLVTLAC